MQNAESHICIGFQRFGLVPGTGIEPRPAKFSVGKGFKRRRASPVDVTDKLCGHNRVIPVTSGISLSVTTSVTMSAKFILDKPDSEVETFIFVMVTLFDGRLKVSLREKIEPKFWDKGTQRPTGKAKDARVRRELQAIAAKISKVDHIVSDYFLTVKLAGRRPLRVELAALISPAVSGSPEVREKGFFEAIGDIYNGMAAGEILTPQNRMYAAHTLKGMRHTIANLKKYQDGTGDKLTFAGVTMATYNGIISYFARVHNHAINSTGKTIKNLKTLMRIAHKAGMHTNDIYASPEFKVIEEAAEDISLTEAELELLAGVDLTGVEDNVRDWFLIDCYTGLRIGDIQGLKESDIVNGRVVSLNDKTGAKVVIPTHSRVKAILAKHGGLPPKTADQVMNRYIKRIAERAGITELIKYRITKGGRRVEFTEPKFTMITNHTARRTFITNLIKAGVDLVSVMQLAGLKKLSTVEKYNKRTLEDTAKMMEGHNYFK